MIYPEFSEPKASVLNHYDIFSYMFVRHKIWIQKIAGSIYELCVLGQVLNMSVFDFIICEVGVLLQPPGGLYLPWSSNI